MGSFFEEIRLDEASEIRLGAAIIVAGVRSCYKRLRGEGAWHGGASGLVIDGVDYCSRGDRTRQGISSCGLVHKCHRPK